MLATLLGLGLWLPQAAFAQDIAVLPSAGISVALSRRPTFGFVAGAEFLVADTANLATELRLFTRYGYTPRFGSNFTTGMATGVIGKVSKAGTAPYLPVLGARVEVGAHFRRGPPTLWLGGASTLLMVGDLHVGAPLKPGARPRDVPEPAPITLATPELPKLHPAPSRPTSDAALTLDVRAAYPGLFGWGAMVTQYDVEAAVQ